jgi:urease accessory protein
MLQRRTSGISRNSRGETMKRAVFAPAAVFASIALLAGPALAHTGADGVSGLAAGFSHPVGGLDHVLAMVAVGILAAQLGGRAVWLVPAAFVATMAVGGLLGVAGVAVPFVEQGIAGSVVILGFVIALGWRMPAAAAMAMAGALAVFHGHAHGAEMPVDASGLAYGAGFALATALLHAAGVGLGLGARKIGDAVAPVAVRIAGGAIAAIGVALVAA